MYFHPHPMYEINGKANAVDNARRIAAHEDTRKLLVAFDGSPAARGALEYAVERARVEGSDLHVVNVQEVLIDNAVIFQAYQQQGERILEDVVEQLAPHEVRFTTEIAFGSPARTIARTARREGCDQIVMGARNRSGIANLLLPGVSRQVLRFAEVPVTVVREVTR